METSAKVLPSVAEYEEIRRKNLEDNKTVLARLMSEIRGVVPVICQSKAKRLRTSSNRDDSSVRRNPSRSARAHPSRFDLPITRSRSGSISSVSSASSTTLSSPEKLVVRFGFFRKPENLEFGSSEAEEDEDSNVDLPSASRQSMVCRDMRSAEEITEADLSMVATVVSFKRYDSINGTSCHQCRQKTDDMKTICRSSNCFGVRGQFCGPCLKNRYGEDAKEALKDPGWECPPCRGICNCSFCRKKGGKSCTGILIHLARERGYSDVHSYLKGLNSSKV